MGGLGTGGRKVPMFVPKMKEWMGNLTQTMQKPYCEHDAMVLILNAPFVFRIVWGFMSMILTAKQKAKVMMLGSTSDAKVRERLFDVVPASMLPRDLGGELPTLQNVYPARDDSAIPDWITRVKGLDFWPPRPAATAATAATSEEPLVESAEPKPTSQEPLVEPEEPAAEVAADAAVEVTKPTAEAVTLGTEDVEPTVEVVDIDTCKATSNASPVPVVERAVPATRAGLGAGDSAQDFADMLKQQQAQQRILAHLISQQSHHSLPASTIEGSTDFQWHIIKPRSCEHEQKQAVLWTETGQAPTSAPQKPATAPGMVEAPGVAPSAKSCCSVQ